MNGCGKERDTLGAVARIALCGAAMAVALMLAPGAATAATGAAAVAEAASKVDVNSASADELASLPGIGASKAAAIIAEREKKPFASVDDLERVRGIGERTVEDLRGKVSVGGH